MNEYLLLYRDDDSESYNLINQKAETRVHFLEQVEDDIVLNKEWILHEVHWTASRKEMKNSGEIDNILDKAK